MPSCYQCLVYKAAPRHLFGLVFQFQQPDLFPKDLQFQFFHFFLLLKPPTTHSPLSLPVHPMGLCHFNISHTVIWTSLAARGEQAQHKQRNKAHRKRQSDENTTGIGKQSGVRVGHQAAQA